MLPATLDLVATMIGKSVAQKLKAILLSNNIICRKIDKISNDISDQLVAKMRGNVFSLRLYEATTSTNGKDAILARYVRFIDNDNNIVQDLLFCKPILTNRKVHELFAILNNFFWKVTSSGNTALVYELMEPKLCLVVLAGCKLSAGRCRQRKMDPLLNTP